MNPYFLANLVGYALVLVYDIFMIMYLSDAEKCDKNLSSRDRDFRKVALAITWVSVVLVGIMLLAGLIILVSGKSDDINYF